MNRPTGSGMKIDFHRFDAPDFARAQLCLFFD